LDWWKPLDLVAEGEYRRVIAAIELFWQRAKHK
jgi:hypothetical protein